MPELTERALKDDEIVAGADYAIKHFFNETTHKEWLDELRNRKIVDMWSMAIGYLVRCGYSVPRAEQIANYMKEKELF